MSHPSEREFQISSSASSPVQVLVKVYGCSSQVRDTHRLDEQGSHLLLGVPRLHAVPHLLQELLVVLQQLRDLVEDLIHQRRVAQQGVLGLLQWLHVALQDAQSQSTLLQQYPHLTCTSLHRTRGLPLCLPG